MKRIRINFFELVDDILQICIIKIYFNMKNLFLFYYNKISWNIISFVIINFPRWWFRFLYSLKFQIHKHLPFFAEIYSLIKILSQNYLIVTIAQISKSLNNPHHYFDLIELFVHACNFRLSAGYIVLKQKKRQRERKRDEGLRERNRKPLGILFNPWISRSGIKRKSRIKHDNVFELFLRNTTRCCLDLGWFIVEIVNPFSEISLRIYFIRLQLKR